MGGCVLKFKEKLGGGDVELREITAINGGSVIINFYEAEDNEGKVLRFSDELKGLVYYCNGFLYIRLKDCMLEIPIKELLPMLLFVAKRRGKDGGTSNEV